MQNAEKKDILVCAEFVHQNELAKVTFELLSEACRLKKKLYNSKVILSCLGFDLNKEKIKQDVKDYGVDILVFAQHPNLKEYSSDLFDKVLFEIIEDKEPSIVLIAATNIGRDLAPSVACALDTGLTADCTKFDISENKTLLSTRPTFGGKLFATIECRNKVQMATARENVFPIEKTIQNQNLEIEEFRIKTNLGNSLIEVVKRIEEAFEQKSDLKDAKIVVSGGMGLKNKAGFEKLFAFAKKIGASVGASRKAVERKLIDPKYQIGQTGTSIRPNLYIAIGISGALQHVSGVCGCKRIIAVNNNPNAAIFDFANIGIVSDCFDFFEKMSKI